EECAERRRPGEPVPGGDRARIFVVGLGEKTVPRFDAREPLASSTLAITVGRHTRDDDLLQVPERPRTWRVQRSEAAKLAGEIALIRFAPGERDRLAPERLARVAEPPTRREHRGQVVRVVVVARALATRTGHRIRESPVDREVLE